MGRLLGEMFGELRASGVGEGLPQCRDAVVVAVLGLGMPQYRGRPARGAGMGFEEVAANIPQQLSLYNPFSLNDGLLASTELSGAGGGGAIGGVTRIDVARQN